ncbi:PREDICTED: tsukushin [Papilio xuthus]|uniref:Tsukushin n=1 Tax=Papilio xuthus TaxID=66420 RepID=A0AAJ6ZQA8_PAPXU|nr:PREDICTED: tsukushin [Papilio xuthus]
MKIKMIRLYIIWLGLALNVSCKELTDLEVLASAPTRCTYEHAYDMLGAHCGGLRLTKIPSLRGGIEILDFSDNKLQELHADTLSSYSSIKFLYLAENQIYMIDKNAFVSLSYLETLDLSKNVILALPDSIFQLPSLRKLYLNGNPLLHMSLKDLTITKPIQAPLELLDLSDCKINKLPDWGILPNLVLYNISHNPLTTLEPQHFSTMCKLAKVDLTESIDNLKLCELKATVIWFQEKNVYFHLSDYNRLNTREFDNCPKPEISATLNASYHLCESVYTQVQNTKTSRRTWLTIGGGLAGFLVGFVLLLYIMHRHNVAQTKRTAKEKTAAAAGVKNASTVLLNDVS